MTGAGRHPAERAADELVREWRIADPSDLHHLEDLAFMAGALVVDDDLDGAQARLVSGTGGAVIRISKALTPERRRFAIGHELGHLRMHAGRSAYSRCTHDDLSLKPHPNEANALAEHDANVFASALLMPSSLFAPRLSSDYPTVNHIEALAAEFATSLTATAIRYVRLTKYWCAVIYAVEGIVKWAVSSEGFRSSFKIYGGPVDRCSLAGLLGEFRGESSATQTRIPATAWLAGNDYDPGSALRELCWPMPKYRATLSLIVLDSDVLGVATNSVYSSVGI